MIDTVESIYGPVAIFDTDTTQYPWLKTTGAAPDDYHIEFVRNLLKETKRGTIIDVGACYGFWSLGLSDLADSIIAIEPQRAILDLLVTNFVANLPQGKALAINCAAWHAPQTLSVPIVDYDLPENYGAVSLKITTSKSYRVEGMPVDNLVGKDKHVSFIKIDVEGAEREALMGAQKTIARCRPIMFVENEHPMTHKEGLRVLLDSMSYALEERGNNFLCVPWRSN